MYQRTQKKKGGNAHGNICPGGIFARRAGTACPSCWAILPFPSRWASRRATRGLSAFQAGLASFLLNASAGEYAAFSAMAAGAGYLEAAFMVLVANARYLLMSFALSQKLAPTTPVWKRLLVGYDVTDEIFALAIRKAASWPRPTSSAR